MENMDIMHISKCWNRQHWIEFYTRKLATLIERQQMQDILFMLSQSKCDKQKQKSTVPTQSPAEP